METRVQLKTIINFSACTHSIGVGEVSGISQPAAEMVVRASPV